MRNEGWAASEPLIEACRPKGETPPHEPWHTAAEATSERGRVAHSVPARRDDAAVARPGCIRDNRNLVERLWARLKDWRAAATRHEKTAASFPGVLCLAATVDRLKP